jgi:FkbM family methyltransferase
MAADTPMRILMDAEGANATNRRMTAQHPIFLKFTHFKGEAPAGYDRDFVGSVTRPWFWGGPPRDAAIEVDVPYPAFDEEYFEWIDLLESVVAARDSYHMIELGAGYGRWAMRAALAIRQYSAIPFHLTAVEADPVHFDWLRMNFEDNGLDPDQHTLVQAAVGRNSGEASLWVASDESRHSPGLWYGQMIVGKQRAKPVKGANYGGYPVQRHKDGRKSITIPQIDMESILRNSPRIDLIDLDVQFQELEAITPAIAGLNAKVKRLHIGTHSTEIEVGLRTLLARHGWECRADYPGRGIRETPWGKIDFDDGVQSWVNPHID